MQVLRKGQGVLQPFLHHLCWRMRVGQRGEKKKNNKGEVCEGLHLLSDSIWIKSGNNKIDRYVWNLGLFPVALVRRWTHNTEEVRILFQLDSWTWDIKPI